MSITGIIFVFIFLVCLFGAVLYHPILGVIGYIISYILSPSGQWWGSIFYQYGMRYSFSMAAAIMIGMLLQQHKLNYKTKLYSQEILFLLLISWVWISQYTGLPQGFFPENFSMKLFKVAIFLWMLVRVVNTQKQYEIVLWTIVLTTAFLGYNALFESTATHGRLDRGLGGSDFSEGNFLAAHFALVLPLLSYFFVFGDKKRKLLCLACALLIINGFILCRSRGAFLAIGVGAFSAIFFTPKGWRAKIIALLIIGLIGSFPLIDKDFIERMHRIEFNVTNVERQDSSASGRILAWRAAVSMAMDHPLGVGQDNFTRYVGQYQPTIPGKDTHSTYLRALAELGFPGLFIMLAMMWNAFMILRKQKQRLSGLANNNQLNFHVFSLTMSLVIFLTAGLFVTDTYIEEFYWLLMFPLLLERVVDYEFITQENEDTQSLNIVKKSSTFLEGTNLN